MSHIVTVPEIRIVGGMAFLFILYSVWMGQMTANGLPGGYRNPVLAFELVKSGDHINQIMAAEDGKARDFISRSIYKDFGYIFVYAFFFICLSLILYGFLAFVLTFWPLKLGDKLLPIVR